MRLPHQWKHSLVVPLFKKGSRYDPLNYRPVSLTFVICKCLERIIAKELVVYFDLGEVFSNDQFGFRSGRSTEDQLLLAYSDITQWVDEGYIADLVLFDFSKAFDVVNHELLLTKL